MFRTLQFVFFLSLFLKLTPSVLAQKLVNQALIDSLQKALQNAVQRNDVRQQALLLQDLAFEKVRMGNFSTSIEDAQRSSNLLDSLGLHNESARNYRTTAMAYNALGNHEKAFYYAQNVLKIAEDIHDEALKAEALTICGIFSDAKSDFRAALRYYEESYKICLKLKDEEGILSQILNIADTQQSLGNGEEALRGANQLISISELKKDSNNLAYGYAIQSSAYLLLKQPKLAAIALKKFENLFEKMQTETDTKQLTAKLKAQVAAANGDFRTAYWAQVEYHTLDSLVKSKEQTERFGQMEISYETKKKDQINLQKQAEIDQKSKIQTGLIFGLASVLGLLGFIFYQNKNIKTKNALLTTQSNQLETMIKEIHHRVKNNLEIINSLLNMQGFQSDDPSVKTSLKEGQSRIKSMALIHNKLYENDNLAKIDFQEYTTELAKTIIATFKKQAEINLTVQAQGVTLDIDTAVPLGLIMNELITNSMKYAYNDVEKGLLSIDILQEKNKNYVLTIMDNGRGLSPDFDIQKAKSLGLRLVQSLVKQLSGVLSIEKPLNTEGVVFRIQFKEAVW